jgi:hypothetical protein
LDYKLFDLRLGQVGIGWVRIEPDQFDFSKKIRSNSNRSDEFLGLNQIMSPSVFTFVKYVFKLFLLQLVWGVQKRKEMETKITRGLKNRKFIVPQSC